MNPFSKEGYLNINASLNKLYIGNKALIGVKQNLQGKRAGDIFSTEIVISLIKENADKLQLDLSEIQEHTLTHYLEECLTSTNKQKKDTAEHILRILGERLATILYCLKNPEQETKEKRVDWSEEHWRYWNSIETIILVGGLASSNIGKNLKEICENVFLKNMLPCYKIELANNSTFAGINGCITKIEIIEKNKVHLIFDFGQSFTKRSFVTVKDNKIGDVILLEKIVSQHVEWDISEEDREQDEAVLLNKSVLEIINKTIIEVSKKGYDISPEIIISIAN